MYDLFFSPAAERYLKKLRERLPEDACRTALLAIMKDPASAPGNEEICQRHMDFILITKVSATK